MKKFMTMVLMLALVGCGDYDRKSGNGGPVRFDYSVDLEALWDEGCVEYMDNVHEYSLSEGEPFYVDTSVLQSELDADARRNRVVVLVGSGRVSTRVHGIPFGMYEVPVTLHKDGEAVESAVVKSDNGIGKTYFEELVLPVDSSAEYSVVIGIEGEHYVKFEAVLELTTHGILPECM